MREIKFRAWNSHLEVMTHDIHHLDTLNEYLSRYNQIVMQFTGFKDKAGIEIYEGDIVEFYHKGEIVQTEIVWNYKGMWSLKWGKNDVNNWYLNPTKYEVVGNIHEKI